MFFELLQLIGIPLEPCSNSFYLIHQRACINKMTTEKPKKVSKISIWKNFKFNFFNSIVIRLSTLLTQSHFRTLVRFILILTSLTAFFSIFFQALMAYEGQEHSWVTGFYWTLSTMSTLGYGDISFTTDPGRLYSIVVLMSGILFMLVLLPFTVIELFYAPWIESRAASLVPHAVPSDMEGHVILTFYSSIATALIEKLVQFQYPYVVILPEIEEVTRLNDKGIYAIYGELNDPKAYRNARVEQASLVATTRSDILNTSVAFTVRGITNSTPVVSTVREEDAVEILQLAGCNNVLNITKLVAEGLARRANGGLQFSHVIGQIDDLCIAEVDSNRTTLVGQAYLVAQWETSVSIVGFWKRGDFQIAEPENVIEADSVLVMAGTREQLKEFDQLFKLNLVSSESKPVVIIGGGRVGRATAEALKSHGIESCIVEKNAERLSLLNNYVHGSAANKSVLQSAGIAEAETVIITMRDDEINIYLTILCRLLHPDIQIINRATLERNVGALHRAGSDIVLSYSSIGANALFNSLHRSDLLMIDEGLDVFKMPIPKDLANKTLAEANFRKYTLCSVIGIDVNNVTDINLRPESVLPMGGEVILIGTREAQAKFHKKYPIN